MWINLTRAVTVLIAILTVLRESSSTTLLQTAITHVDVVIPQQRTRFVLGEAIELTAEIHNGSDVVLLKPRVVDWRLEVRDEAGTVFEDFASPGVSRFWAVGETGETPDFSTVEPGATSVQTFFLQNRFRLHKEGFYSVIFRGNTAQVTNDVPHPFGLLFQIESLPLSFEITRDPVTWQEALGPLVFHVINENGMFSLRFYRRSLGDAYDPIFSEYTIIGEIDQQDPVPELIQSESVTARSGRVGVKFAAPLGTVCSVVEIEDDLVHFSPPIPIGDTGRCPP